MIVRTISQLPEAKSVVSDALLEVSVPSTDGETYSSQCVQYGTIKSDIKTEIATVINNTTKDNNAELQTKVNNLIAGNISFTGIATFDKFPKTLDTDYTESEYGGSDNIIPNMGLVRQELLSNGASFVSTTGSMIADGDPMASGQITYRQMNRGSSTDNNFYYWHIDSNKQDSSERSGSTTVIYEKTRDTGILVVWGWLQDNGSVRAGDAWVALMAEIVPENGSSTGEKWFPISVQPWVRSSTNSAFQYVGFTVPVAADTRLKIRTGFKVSSMASVDNVGPLMFSDNNQPNSFFGYIIKSNKS